MNTNKQKMLAELDEELYRLKFNIAHDSQYLPELIQASDTKTTEAKAIRDEIDAFNNRPAAEQKKKATRDEKQAKTIKYGKAINALKDYRTTIEQLEMKIKIANNKVGMVEKKIVFLTNYEG